jgi:hypothetical protein
MNIFANTIFCAVGAPSNISKLEKEIPIENSKFDFFKVIPTPPEIDYDFETANEQQLEYLKKWATKEWGTPHNGLIDKLEKQYSYGVDSYLINIRTVFNEPVLVLDAIMKNNPENDYFISTCDLFGYTHTAFQQRNRDLALTLCSSDLDMKYTLDKNNINLLEDLNMNYLHWDMLEKTYYGREIKNYLKKIQNKSTI